ncbi:S41 family peptidase [Cupriavidus basilensis]
MAQKSSGSERASILDLRNNGGGVLQGAVGGEKRRSLQDDSTVVSTNGQVPDAKRVYKATFNNHRLSSPRGRPRSRTCRRCTRRSRWSC